ncbi:MAG: DUF465 domain-containing protein [Pseudomonadota bacterium]|nr:DUF465 domain-containing protein [Pseudomonadota bacterium]
MTASIDKHSFDNKIELKKLRVAQRNLDVSIDKMSKQPEIDQLKFRRMKKRKLEIKGLIKKLESEIIPDLNA